MTTPDDPATNWHELIDQMRPEQVRYMTFSELSYDVLEEDADALMAEARGYAIENLTALWRFGDLAEDVEYFQPSFEVKPGLWSRKFVGSVVVPWKDCEVSVAGTQFSNGQIERYLLIGGEDTLAPRQWVELAVTADEGRRLGAVIAQAIDEIERLEQAVKFEVGDCTVVVTKMPNPDRNSEHHLLIDGFDAVLVDMAIEFDPTVEQALLLAAALSNAADEVDRLAYQ